MNGTAPEGGHGMQQPGALVPFKTAATRADGADPTAVLHAFRRRWLPAVALGLLAAGVVATATWLLLPAKLTAITTLKVDSFQRTILPDEKRDPDNFLNYQKTQAAIIKGRLVLNRTLQKVGNLRLLAKRLDPIQWLERDLKTDFNEAPEILRITLSGDEPDDLMALVGAIRTVYLEEIVGKERTDREERLLKLTNLAAVYDGQLRERRNVVRQLAEEAGTQDTRTLAVRQQVAMEQIVKWKMEIVSTRAELRKATVQLASLPDKDKAAKEMDIPADLIEDEMKQDLTVIRKLEDVERIDEELLTAKQRFTQGDQNPRLNPIRDRLTVAKAALEARKAEIRPKITEQLRAKAVRSLVATESQLKKQIDVLKNLDAALDADIKGLEKQSQSLNKNQISQETYRIEIAQFEETAKQVAAEIERLKLGLLAPLRVTPWEEPYISTADGEKRRLMATLAGAAGALGLVIVGFTWFELRARRVGTVTEVKNSMNVRLLGSLPPLSVRRDLFGRARPADEPAPQLMEAVDAARTVLLSTMNGESLRCVMVTSAASGEGKTSLSSHLATSLARVGYQTLLVDGDMRRPAVHRVFDLPQGPGLAEILRGELGLNAAIQASGIDGLAVMPAGRCDEASLQALARESCQEVFRTLRAMYDYVIVDTPPILPVVDALLIGRSVDGAIFSVMRDVSRIPMMLAAHERLTQLGVRVLGAVVSGVAHEGYGTSYDRYYTAPEATTPAEPVTVTAKDAPADVTVDNIPG
jgi:capsular exopolysaccharide synthesis family protein